MIDKTSRLILLMLSDIYEKLELGDVDPSLLREALISGHDWYIEEDLVFLPQGSIPSRVRAETRDFMAMWGTLEWSYEIWEPADKTKFGGAPIFPGFDFNNEKAHASVARFYQLLPRYFDRFNGRDLNSHSEVLEGYEQMLVVYEPMRAQMTGDPLSPEQVTEILEARRGR